MATINRTLGKNQRLFFGNTASPTNDTNYTAVTNENSHNVKFTADLVEDDTKEAGRLVSPGNESWEISGEFNEIFDDAGLALLEGAQNTPWKVQIRDTSRAVGKTTDTVWIEGQFIVSDIEYTNESAGSRAGTFTMRNSGPVTRSRPARALVTS